MRKRHVASHSKGARGRRGIVDVDHTGPVGCAPAEGTNEGELLADAQEWDIKTMMHGWAHT